MAMSSDTDGSMLLATHPTRGFPPEHKMEDYEDAFNWPQGRQTYAVSKSDGTHHWLRRPDPVPVQPRLIKGRAQ